MQAVSNGAQLARVETGSIKLVHVWQGQAGSESLLFVDFLDGRIYGLFCVPQLCDVRKKSLLASVLDQRVPTSHSLLQDAAVEVDKLCLLLLLITLLELLTNNYLPGYHHCFMRRLFLKRRSYSFSAGVLRI